MQGIELDLDSSTRFNARTAIDRVEMALEEESGEFRSIMQLVRAQVIDRAYQGKSTDVDLYSLLNLHGPNDSQLPYEVFRPGEKVNCSQNDFKKRTHLRINRTLLNLKELLKAYGGSQLSELEAQLNSYLNLNTSPGVLRQKLIALTKSKNFSVYLEQKQDFLDQWTQESEIVQGKPDVSPLADNDLSETMKALIRQKPLFQENPQVLRYNDYHFFRPFNSISHGVLESSNLGFWKTESNRNEFHKMITIIRQKYQVNAPFHVFRFENSFTYLICGFSDESISKSILDDQETAPVHAKIIMRQSNKNYRELQSDDNGNRTLYYNCLKEAMLPFAEHLNSRLQMNLSPSFIDFFRI